MVQRQFINYSITLNDSEAIYKEAMTMVQEQFV